LYFFSSLFAADDDRCNEQWGFALVEGGWPPLAQVHLTLSWHHLPAERFPAGGLARWMTSIPPQDELTVQRE
jgi:hypothetical protein